MTSQVRLVRLVQYEQALPRLLLHSPLVGWAPFASNVYHDWLWYPTVGRARIRAFAATPWGRRFERD